ncbi:cadherin-86C [Anabrus simplex]|uniref:cadherin-86C n=1 Tax=Anabrus simplex TaxID=316456 RepID=UPI0035A3311F
MIAPLLVVFTLALTGARANFPLFDLSTLMRILLVPADAKVGSALYRFKASDSDFDFPLHFDVASGPNSDVIRLEDLPCRRNESHCEANVILAKPLQKGRVYELKVFVRDTRGDTTTINCTIKTTNASTPMDTIFPHMPSLIMVPEDAERGTVLDYVIATNHPKLNRHAMLQLTGSSIFTFGNLVLASPTTVNVSIILSGSLDFETQITYQLTVYATDAYAEPENDTRNLMSFSVAVVVTDVQDMPPVFTTFPPVTRMSSSLQTGDVVVEVHAEDGDKGFPRPIRYGLVSENNPFATYFSINEITGAVSFTRTLKELVHITRSYQPILLTIVADEVRASLQEPPSMSTTVQVALMLDSLGNSPPYFESTKLVAHIDENSPQGTAVSFPDPYVTQIKDDDMGQLGVFSISLTDNGTFEVSPSVGEKTVDFLLQVRNPAMLDYETQRMLEFNVVAHELSPEGGLSSTAQVQVYIDDVNDNPPVFEQSLYEAVLPENVTAGVVVVRVQAHDVDTGKFGAIHYTRILGPLNNSLLLDPISGTVTVATNSHHFDREQAPEYRFYVEARDMDGDPVGISSTVPLVIKLLDVNDNTPEFDKQTYEFILAPDMSNFTTRAFIKAMDKDAEAPNNVVQYEFTNGQLANKFNLNKDTGELTLKEPLTSSKSPPRYKRDSATAQYEAVPAKHSNQLNVDKVIELVVRAYDLGVPHRSSFASVRVYPPGTRSRTMWFIVPGTNLDMAKTTEMLVAITGGQVKITSVTPYGDNDAAPSKKERENLEPMARETAADKTMIEAEVSYDENSVVDLTVLQNNLKNGTIIVAAAPVEKRRADSMALFWILIVLAILIVIAIIILILCCICPGWPLYISPRKRARVHSEENVQLVYKEQGAGEATESKAVQAEWGSRSRGMREAWSADHKQRYWRFNRRNQPAKEEGAAFSAGLAPAAAEHHHSFRSLPGGPSVIYSRELQALNQKASEHRRDVFLEDVEGGQLVDPRETRVHHASRTIAHEEDVDSIRRHEAERGSDVVIGRRGNPPAEYRLILERATPGYEQEEEDQGATMRREQFYIREGNAEILRLVTRGRSDEEQQTADSSTQQQQNRPMTFMPGPHQRGKEIIMQRFMEDQRHTNSLESTQTQQDTLIRQAAQDLDMSQQLQQQQQQQQQQQDMLLSRILQEEEARIMLSRLQQEQQQRDEHQQQHQLETQSLPGQMCMATQTDVDNSTQTEPLHLLRPPRRQVKSDNDESFTDDELATSASTYRLRLIRDVSTPPKGERWLRRNLNRRKRHHGEQRLKRVESKRHKIKTPIIEETESALEAAVKEPVSVPTNYMENKSSMLRRRKVKSNLVKTASGDMEVSKAEEKRKVTQSEEDDEETPSDSLDEQSPQRKERKRRRKKKEVSEEEASENEKSHRKKQYDAQTHLASPLEEQIESRRKQTSKKKVEETEIHTRSRTSSRSKRDSSGEDTDQHDYRHSSRRDRWETDGKERSSSTRQRADEDKDDDDNHRSHSRRRKNSVDDHRRERRLHSRHGRESTDESEDDVKDQRIPSRRKQLEEDGYEDQSPKKTSSSRRRIEFDADVRYYFQRDSSSVQSSPERRTSPKKTRQQRPRSRSLSAERRHRRTLETKQPKLTSQGRGQEEQAVPGLKTRPPKLSKSSSKSSTEKSASEQEKKTSTVQKKAQPATAGKKPDTKKKVVGSGRSKSVMEKGTPPEVPPSRRASVSSSAGKPVSRYMEWYKTKREERERKKREEEEERRKLETGKGRSKGKVRGKTPPAAVSSPEEKTPQEEKKEEMKEPVVVSEAKVEEQQVLKVAALEDDQDSGIAMSSLLGAKRRKHHQLLEKKSVFTIAYDDVQTKQIRPDSSSPPY